MKKSDNFWCEYCSKKYTIDDFENIPQIDLSKIQKKVPYLEVEKNKKTKPVFVERQKKIKCVNCGYILRKIENDKSGNKPS
jgi:hypothetical protein